MPRPATIIAMTTIHTGAPSENDGGTERGCRTVSIRLTVDRLTPLISAISACVAVGFACRAAITFARRVGRQTPIYRISSVIRSSSSPALTTDVTP